MIAPVAEIARIGDHLDITPNALLNKVDTVVVNFVLDCCVVMVVQFPIGEILRIQKNHKWPDSEGEHLM